MRKIIFILYALVLFVFNGNAQFEGGHIQNQVIDCNPNSVIIQSFSGMLPTFSNPQYSWIVALNYTEYMNDNTKCWQVPSTYYTNGGTNLNHYNIRSGSIFITNKPPVLISSLDSLIYIRRAKNLTTNTTYESNIVVIYPNIKVTGGSIAGDDTLCAGFALSDITSVVPAVGDQKFSLKKYVWAKDGVLDSSTGDIDDENYTSGTIYTSTQTFFRAAYFSPGFNYMCYVRSNTITKTLMDCGVFSSTIIGPATITPGQTSIYSVPEQPGMKYLWSVTSGTITGGQGTYTITIMWDGGASANTRTSVAEYAVSVTETNDAQASKTTTQAITMTTTDVNKGFASAGISVFPNPVKNQFSMKCRRLIPM